MYMFATVCPLALKFDASSLIHYTQALNTGCATVRPTSTKVSNVAMCHPLPLYKLRAEALVEPEVFCSL